MKDKQESKIIPRSVNVGEGSRNVQISNEFERGITWGTIFFFEWHDEKINFPFLGNCIL